MSETSIILEELRQLRRLVSDRAPKPTPIHVDAAEAARLLGVCEKTLGKWTREGKLARFVEDGVYRYRVADLEAFSKERAKVQS